jgi:hypothetical protein
MVSSSSYFLNWPFFFHLLILFSSSSEKKKNESALELKPFLALTRSFEEHLRISPDDEHSRCTALATELAAEFAREVPRENARSLPGTPGGQIQNMVVNGKCTDGPPNSLFHPPLRRKWGREKSNLCNTHIFE